VSYLSGSINLVRNVSYFTTFSGLVRKDYYSGREEQEIRPNKAFMALFPPCTHYPHPPPLPLPTTQVPQHLHTDHDSTGVRCMHGWSAYQNGPPGFFRKVMIDLYDESRYKTTVLLFSLF